jgi:hypothetical protein
MEHLELGGLDSYLRDKDEITGFNNGISVDSEIWVFKLNHSKIISNRFFSTNNVVLFS